MTEKVHTPHASSSGHPARRPRRRGPPWIDYWRVLRHHWIVAGLAALIVIVLVLRDTLLEEPVYEAFAKVQIDRSNMSEADLMWGYWDTASVVDAELEVMRALPVVTLAAQAPDALVRVVVREKNAYRPLETALRSFGGGTAPCPVTAHLDPPPEQDLRWEMTFDAPGEHLTIRSEGRGEGRAATTVLLRSGEPFTVGAYTLRLDVVGEGSLGGREYLLIGRPLEKAARVLQQGAKIRSVGASTGIVEVGSLAPTPLEAARNANALAAAYQGYKESQKGIAVGRRAGWLKSEAKRIAGELEELEKERDEYVISAGAVLLSERAKAILDEQAELTRERLVQEEERREVAAHLKALADSLPTDERLLSLESVDAMTQAWATRLANARTERSLLRKVDRATEENQAVIRLDAEIAELEGLLDERLGALVQKERDVLTQRLAKVDRRLEQIQQTRAEQEKLLNSLPALEREVVRRTRPIAAREALYEYLVKNQKEAEVTQASVLSSVIILDPAREPQVRVSPNLTRKVILALFLGLLAAACAAWLLEQMDHKVRNPQELEEGLGLPLYTTIPAYGSIPRRDRRALKGAALPTRDIPSSLLSESYRTLRANLRFASGSERAKTLAITSALQQEGKTVTTLNLAITMAQAGDRVIVVDADMRRPSTHVHLGGEREPGLVEILRDGESWLDMVRETDVPGLSVIHAGRPPHNPGALLDSAAFVQLLADLRENYDQVLFDVPPVLAVADSASFFRQLDGMLLLVRYRRAHLEIVQGAREQIERLGGKLVGVVFNAFDLRRSARRGYGYYGYYSYYSHYGYEARPGDSKD